ncbi:hypothetical protein AB6A40_006663 [Gnathostoma spinigerum]|uniref:ENT domain-containing protein n=1 Tax=Gnathostoma spinigerum TaxID=75299 RepID=A0ABD6ERP1_9BILA
MAALELDSKHVFNEDINLESLDNIDEEDCSYMLRCFETEAFSSVVSAMRAQGMLTEYKEVLLDHLKTALFISDESFKAEIRRAANDERLSLIARTLNPSYDTFAQWGCRGTETIPQSLPNIKLYDDDEMSGMEVADQLLRLANSHNSTLRDSEDALGRLIALPKAPFVPERLRALLRETETNSQDRLPVVPVVSREKEFHRSPKKNECDRKVGMFSTGKRRGRKPKTRTPPSPAVEDAAVSVSVKLETGTQSSSLLPYSNERDQVVTSGVIQSQNCISIPTSVQSAADALTMISGVCGNSAGRSDQSTCSAENFDKNLSATTDNYTVHIAQTLSPTVSDIQKECQLNVSSQDCTTTENGKIRKKRLKMRDNSAFTCARVRPFVFEPIPVGSKVKPVRGNPDKRATKRQSPVAQSAFTLLPSSSISSSSSASSATSTSLPASSSSLPSRNVPLSPSMTADATRLHPASHSGMISSGLVMKRARTNSAGADSLVAENGFHLRQTGNTIAFNKAQTLIPRTFVRTASRAKFIVSTAQAASAYSSPTRPYYGNPSAAAMGITIRPAVVTNNENGVYASGEKSLIQSSATAASSQQTLEVQHLAGQEYAAHSVYLSPYQQSKALKRSSVSTKPNSFVIGTTSRTGSVFGDAAGGVQIASASYPFITAVPVCTSRSLSLPGPSVLANGECSEPIETGTVCDVPVASGSDSVNNGRVTNTSKASEDSADANSQGVRLECDEVMPPEQRCIVPTSGGGVLALSPPFTLNRHILRPLGLAQSEWLLLNYNPQYYFTLKTCFLAFL